MRCRAKYVVAPHSVQRRCIGRAEFDPHIIGQRIAGQRATGEAFQRLDMVHQRSVGLDVECVVTAIFVFEDRCAQCVDIGIDSRQPVVIVAVSPGDGYIRGHEIIVGTVGRPVDLGASDIDPHCVHARHMGMDRRIGIVEDDLVPQGIGIDDYDIGRVVDVEIVMAASTMIGVGPGAAFEMRIADIVAIDGVVATVAAQVERADLDRTEPEIHDIVAAAGVEVALVGGAVPTRVGDDDVVLVVGCERRGVSGHDNILDVCAD